MSEGDIVEYSWPCCQFHSFYKCFVTIATAAPPNEKHVTCPHCKKSGFILISSIDGNDMASIGRTVMEQVE